jgi:hypothetical protein
MPPLSRFYYHHSAFSTAIAPAATKRDRDWDKGALLIIAIVAIPIIIASAIAIVLAM